MEEIEFSEEKNTNTEILNPIIERVKVNISNTILEVDKRILLEIPYFKALYEFSRMKNESKISENIFDLNNENITLSAFMYIIDKYNGKDVEFSYNFIPTFEFLNINYQYHNFLTNIIKYVNPNGFMYIISYATINNRLDLIEIIPKYNLINLIASFPEDRYKIFKDAIFHNNFTIFKYLYNLFITNTSYNLDIDKHWINYLAKTGNIEFIKFLYNDYHKLFTENLVQKYPLLYAAKNDQAEVVQFLCEKHLYDIKILLHVLECAKNKQQNKVVIYLYNTYFAKLNKYEIKNKNYKIIKNIKEYLQEM
jgi:hypothetical protein